ncbi:MAG: ABC transporter permease [Actinobacteria bacterium]|nr:ABC transporter permease [Actinomycetota bacterium]
MGAYFRIVSAIARRSILRIVRRPQSLMPIFIVPTVFLAVTSGGVARAVDLPGFPQVDSFFHFAIAGAIVQSTMLGGLMTGITTSIDVDNGFFDRMIVAPVPRSALVLGRVLGGGAIAIFQAALYLALGLAFGAPLRGGVVGVLLIMALAALCAASLGGLATALALRAQAQWVQGMFPVIFVIIFLSSAFFPRELMTGPAAAIAAYNPISYIAEGIREPIITGLDLAITLEAFGVALALTAVTSLIAVWALRVRLGGAS